MKSARHHRHPVEQDVARAGKRGDFDREEGIAFDRIGEAEIRRGEDIGIVLAAGDALVRAGGRVVDRIDVEGERVRRLVGILAAIGGAAIVADLEGEAGHGRAICVGRRIIGQRPKSELGGGDEPADIGEDAGQAAGAVRIVDQEAGGRQAGEDNARKGIAVGGVAEAEVRRGQDPADILVDDDGGVGAGGRVVDRGDVEGERVRRLVGVEAAIDGAAIVADREIEARIAGAVAVGAGREDELAGGELRGAHERAYHGDRDAVQQQRAVGGQARQQHAGEAVALGRIGEAEIGLGQDARAVLVDRDRGAGAGRGVVDGGDADYRCRRAGGSPPAGLPSPSLNEKVTVRGAIAGSCEML